MSDSEIKNPGARRKRAPGPQIGDWDRRLFRDADKQRAGQFAVCTNEGCVVGFIGLPHNSRGSGVGLFLRQRFVGRTIVVKLCVDGGLSVLRQGSLGSNEIRTIR